MTRTNEAYRIQRLREVNCRHDKVGTQVYHAWSNMIQRCINENVPHFSDYGGKGVTVCDAWLDDFLNFFEDMGDPPSSEHSLDRIDYLGNYEPDNCRWADKQTQINNRCNTVWLTLNDVTLPMSIWATKLGINYETLRMRRSRGWSDTKLLTTPTRKLT